MTPTHACGVLSFPKTEEFTQDELRVFFHCAESSILSISGVHCDEDVVLQDHVADSWCAVRRALGNLLRLSGLLHRLVLYALHQVGGQYGFHSQQLAAIVPSPKREEWAQCVQNVCSKKKMYFYLCRKRVFRNESHCVWIPADNKSFLRLHEKTKYLLFFNPHYRR